jgi:hypothetical protein
MVVERIEEVEVVLIVLELSVAGGKPPSSSNKDAPASGSLAGRLGKNLYVFYNLILG